MEHEQVFVPATRRNAPADQGVCRERPLERPVSHARPLSAPNTHARPLASLWWQRCYTLAGVSPQVTRHIRPPGEGVTRRPPHANRCSGWPSALGCLLTTTNRTVACCRQVLGAPNTRGEQMFGRTYVRRTYVLWITPVDNVVLIPRLWTTLWTTRLWTTPVDNDEVIPRLWIRLWITWGRTSVRAVLKCRCGAFSTPVGVWGAHLHQIFRRTVLE